MLTRKRLDTIASALRDLTHYLQPFSTTPRLDAELILAHSLKRPRTFLYTYAEQIVTAELQDIIFDYLERRCDGEPIAYIVGTKEFWSLELQVTRDTLIPRPETEHLIEWILEHLPLTAITIADLGTGSGAIAIALAHARRHWTVHASDTSASALNIAIHNARQHHLTNIEFYLGSWYQALPSQRYTAIISNPPYIAIDDPHLSHLSYEPSLALCAAEQGYAAFSAIIRDAKRYLLPHGKLIVEHGYNQATMLITMLKQAGFTHIQSHCDLAKQMRFVVAS